MLVPTKNQKRDIAVPSLQRRIKIFIMLEDEDGNFDLLKSFSVPDVLEKEKPNVPFDFTD